MAAAPNVFAGAALDRAGAHRTDAAWLAERLADPASRAIVVTPDGVLLAPHPDATADASVAARIPLADAAGPATDAPVLLGIDGAAALFAVDVPTADATRLLPGARIAGLRDAGSRLGQADGGLVAYASAIVGWHRAHPHCAVCGAPTDVAEAGHVRHCPSCGATHQPRTDPVVIMLVADDERDRILLGRQPTWPAGRFSALAGFVEPGESLEEAVAREVLEETGVTIAEPRYVSSQPWPFPAQLMLGFTAAYAGGEASVRDGELDDVRWFSGAEVEDAAAGRGDLAMPPPVAIARRLIEGWLETRG
jgi:NAD+ diphosphatase